MPVSSYLLDVTISDPCDADIWSNLVDFGVLEYTFAAPKVTQIKDITNTLSAGYCEFQVVSVLDDWTIPLSASKIVKTTNTNTTLTL